MIKLCSESDHRWSAIAKSDVPANQLWRAQCFTLRRLHYTAAFIPSSLLFTSHSRLRQLIEKLRRRNVARIPVEIMRNSKSILIVAILILCAAVTHFCLIANVKKTKADSTAQKSEQLLTADDTVEKSGIGGRQPAPKHQHDIGVHVRKVRGRPANRKSTTKSEHESAKLLGRTFEAESAYLVDAKEIDTVHTSMNDSGK